MKTPNTPLTFDPRTRRRGQLDAPAPSRWSTVLGSASDNEDVVVPARPACVDFPSRTPRNLL
jgi:hypothetical protein